MTGRIFITGDKHGTFLPLFGLVEKNKMQAADILIIAGDAGYVWDQDYPYAIETLQQIFPGIIAFIDGNHENHALLNNSTVEKWHGGKVHRIGERVYHLMRGEMYSIYGNNIFTFGGARSNDKDRREENISWWKEEEPSPEEVDFGKKKFLEKINEIDYIITHETPLFARAFISRSKPLEEDYVLPMMLEEWYQMIIHASRFKKWYFGHMHTDQDITPQLRAIHNDILLIGENKKMRWA